MNTELVFEKINKIEKPLALLTQKKYRRHKLPILGTKQVITTDTADGKWIIEYYKLHINSHKYENLGKTEHFLEKHKLPSRPI